MSYVFSLSLHFVYINSRVGEHRCFFFLIRISKNWPWTEAFVPWQNHLPPIQNKQQPKPCLGIGIYLLIIIHLGQKIWLVFHKWYCPKMGKNWCFFHVSQPDEWVRTYLVFGNVTLILIDMCLYIQFILSIRLSWVIMILYRMDPPVIRCYKLVYKPL